jgi:hypothetical protein
MGCRPYFLSDQKGMVDILVDFVNISNANNQLNILNIWKILKR